MATVQKVERRPSHETIVDFIRIASLRELYNLAKFIKATVIPKNHEAIAEAWRKKLRFHGLAQEDTFGVLTSLEEQKREIEAEVRAVEQELVDARLR